VPLGIAKAVRNGSRFDTVTSVLVLAGYAIPGFVLGVLLLMLFGGGTFWQVFPMRGLTSDNFNDLSAFGKVLDYLWHIVLPVTASVVGNFAIVTILTKNTFLEEIGRQYVLTARAKGAPERDVLWKHVLRNAAIPLLTGLPAAFVGAFLNGNLLIETLFSLDGMGQLSYDSVIRRDYPVVLGSLFLFTLIALVTKLIADVCYVLVDPRIQFNRLDR
jgi:microcin C transport system permease protein